MVIIGHRGAAGLANENSLPAITMALDNHVDMIELDVRVHNKQLVLSHEKTLKTEGYTTLQDALHTVNGVIPINLEIKELSVVSRLSKALQHYEGEILFSSFEFQILQELKKQFPSYPLAVLERWSGIRAVAVAAYLGTDRLHINQKWLWGGFVRSIKQQNYSLYAYTVNNIERATELAEWGVDGIFTDRPDMFKNHTL